MQIWVHCVGLSSARNPKNSLSLTITLTRHPGSVSKTFLRILERVFNLFFFFIQIFLYSQRLVKACKRLFLISRTTLWPSLRATSLKYSILFFILSTFCFIFFTNVRLLPFLVLFTKTGTS